MVGRQHVDDWAVALEEDAGSPCVPGNVVDTDSSCNRFVPSFLRELLDVRGIDPGWNAQHECKNNHDILLVAEDRELTIRAETRGATVPTTAGPTAVRNGPATRPGAPWPASGPPRAESSSGPVPGVTRAR